MNISHQYRSNLTVKKSLKNIDDMDINLRAILDDMYYMMPVSELKTVNKRYDREVKRNFITISNTGSILGALV